MEDQRITLYRNIADLTIGYCKENCKRLGACCDEFSCNLTIEYAKEAYGVELPTTGHPTIPLLNADGCCSVAPHFRPSCSLHQCDISSVGVFQNASPSLTEEYFKLYFEVQYIENQLYLERKNASNSVDQPKST